MKILMIVVAVMLVAGVAYAGHVNGYMKKDGTYVSGYDRSAPDSTVRNNYGYEGNTNPNTGSEGHNHYRNNPSSEWYGTSNNDGWKN